jgi:hypothetical protein
MFRKIRSAGLALALTAIAVVPAGAAFAQEFVQSGGLLPAGSNGQGEPQPANSLPQGFYNGTSVMQHRQALQTYWSGQDGVPSSASRG